MRETKEMGNNMQDITDLEILFEKFRDRKCTKEELQRLEGYLKRDDLTINILEIMDKYVMLIQFIGEIDRMMRGNPKPSKDSEVLKQRILSAIKRLNPDIRP